MADMAGVLSIIALSVIAPIWILSHYITKWKMAKGLSTDEARLLEELWNMAQRMEKRVESLEMILDDNADAWRRRR